MTDLARLRRLSESLPTLGEDGEWLAAGIMAHLDGDDPRAVLGLSDSLPAHRNV